ncbi:MAG: monofunctional biosynthetic peptidoglycan transglycosylase [Deltaproteobacteria bacterium]|nr:monofunctional biosynthetic peptidoglycan transglycosylase [Deltaproteobacteria bacterium]
MSRRKKKTRSRLRLVLLWALLFVVGSQTAYLILLKWIDPPLTITQVLAAFEERRFERKYVELESISIHARLAVIAAEDQRFPSHNGFDWRSIQQTIQHNRKHKKRIRGASTISQQAAKNIFLWQTRSWPRKGLEAYFTVLIELTLEKRRILKIYLNIIEMGPGIFGIEAAAKHYFNKPAGALGRREAALIAACLPNPKIYRADKPTPRIRNKAKWILEQMEILRKSASFRPLLD